MLMPVVVFVGVVELVLLQPGVLILLLVRDVFLVGIASFDDELA